MPSIRKYKFELGKVKRNEEMDEKYISKVNNTYTCASFASEVSWFHSGKNTS